MPLKNIRLIIVLTLFVFSSGMAALAQDQRTPSHSQAAGLGDLSDKVYIQQKLGAPVPQELEFNDETGKPVKLKQFLGKRPVIFIMPFFKCGGTCVLEVEGMLLAANKLKYTIGKDYEVVIVSIDPRESWEHAAMKKEDYLRLYLREGAADGIHCLTGTKENILAMADALGFRFIYNPKTGDPVHPAGLMISTPSGRMTRYLNGVDFKPKTLNLSLVEASENKIGTLTEKFTILCSQYNEHSGKYTVAIKRILTIAAMGTVLILGTFITSMLYLEKKRKRSGIDDVKAETTDK